MPAEPGMGGHRCPRRCLGFRGMSMRRVLLGGIVNSVVVVVVHILANQPPEMFFVQRDDMIQDLPAAVSDPAFGDSVLPRRSYSCSLRLQALPTETGSKQIGRIYGARHQSSTLPGMRFRHQKPAFGDTDTPRIPVRSLPISTLISEYCVRFL